jgi:hypothetical protein
MTMAVTNAMISLTTRTLLGTRMDLSKKTSMKSVPRAAIMARTPTTQKLKVIPTKKTIPPPTVALLNVNFLSNKGNSRMLARRSRRMPASR